MNGYICIYRGKPVEVRTETSYMAQCKAAEELGVPDNERHLIAVSLCELTDGKPHPIFAD